MTLRTSIVVAGDTDGAQKALADLERGMERAGAEAQNLAGAERSAEAATDALEAKLRAAMAAIGAVNDNFAASANGARESAKGSNDAARASLALFAAEERLEAALSSREAAQRRAAAAAEEGAEEQERAAGALAAANARVAASIIGVEQAQAGVNRAGGAVVRSLGEQQLGARMLGQQFQDMGVMASMSSGSLTDWMRIFSTQIGQTALALEQMGAKGALGAVAAFMNTPWGAAATAAGLVLVPFIGDLFETEKAAELAKEGTSHLGDAQGIMAELFGKASSKIKEQNELLRVNAQLKSINLRAEAAQMTASSTKTFGNSGKQSWGDYIGGAFTLDGFGVLNGTPEGANNATALRNIVRQLNAGKLKPEDALSMTEGMDFSGVNVSKTEFQQAVVDKVTARLDEKLAALIDQSLASGHIASGLERPGQKHKPKSTDARDEFGRDATDKIDSIVESFSDVPSKVQQADKAIRQLDDLIDDLQRKGGKKDLFAGTIASAENAKKVVEAGLIRSIGEAFEAPKTLADKAADALGTLDQLLADEARKLKAGLVDQAGFDEFSQKVAVQRQAIQDGLNRPYEEFIQAQQDALAIQGLLSQGREAEANALRAVIQLEKQLPPLDAAHKAGILESVRALDAEARATDALHQKQQAYLDAIQDVRSLISQTIEEGAKGLENLPDRLLGSFKKFFAGWATESIFGPALRQLEDLVHGRPEDPVKAAAVRVAAAVDDVTDPIRRLGALIGTVAGGGSAQGLGLEHLGTSLGAQIAAELGGDAGIVVKAQQRGGLGDPRAFFAETIDKLAEKLGIDEKTAKKIGQGIAGGLEGAFYGQLASGLAGELGIKQSGTGASIGGALGGAAANEFLSKTLGSFAGPVGGIVGGLLGGILGGLLGGSKPFGTAILGSASDPARIGGSSSDTRSGAGGLADQVQSGLKQIADQLGGTLGDFDLAIGTFDGKYRVRTTTSGWDGNGPLDYNGNSGNNLVDFGDDETSAIAFAIMDAVKDGAVKGLSPAIQKALGSSPDINEALQEAMKVADVEQLLGGLPAELTGAFKDFEREAADRLRIAREYGFDIVKVEEINAKQRLDLTNQLMEQQVGSLQRLIEEMTSGSLFEGSSVDQRTALLTAIEQAKADLDNGVAGAADKLAGLFEQLDAVSKDVYGTTGGFAADRSEILDQARAAIAAANAQIVAAQAQAAQGSDPALTTTNQLLDEGVDKQNRLIDGQADTNRLLEQIAASAARASSSALQDLARTS